MTRSVALLCALLALATADWALTLLHLRAGVEEANPLLRATLAAGGVWLFTAVKLGVTFAAGAFLLCHVRARLTRLLLPPAVAVYAGVLVVHAATAAATAGV